MKEKEKEFTNSELLTRKIAFLLQQYKYHELTSPTYIYKVSKEILAEDELCAEGLFFRYLATVKECNEHFFEDSRTASYQVVRSIATNENLNYYVSCQTELLEYLDEEFYNYIYQNLKRINSNTTAIIDILINPYKKDEFFKRLESSYNSLTAKMRIMENYIVSTHWKEFYFNEFLETSKWQMFSRNVNRKFRKRDALDIEDKINKCFYEFMFANQLEGILAKSEIPYISFVWQGLVKEDSDEEYLVERISQHILDYLKKFFNNVKYCFVLRESEYLPEPPKESVPVLKENNDDSLTQLIIKSRNLLGEEYKDIRKVLKELEEQKNLLEKSFKDKEKLNLFLKIRCEQYVNPYLIWIIDKKGKLENSELARFEKVFSNIALILKAKREEIERNEKEKKYVEFDVIEKEIENYIKEEKIK